MRHKDHEGKGRHNFLTGSELVEFRTTTVRARPLDKPPEILEDLNKLGHGLTSENIDGQLEAARQLRGMLSSERDVVVDEVCGGNVY